jgi:methylated-DNA-protein-cysteine methyltransferase-like protein
MNKSLNFYEQVLEVVKQIPYGKVTTYGLIAAYLGQKRSARMVGWVLNKQKNNKDIPAHRVVNRKGLLTGKIHFEGINLMQELLESEGVEVKNNQIVNLGKYLWLPTDRLKDE